MAHTEHVFRKWGSKEERTSWEWRSQRQDLPFEGYAWSPDCLYPHPIEHELKL